MDYLPCTKNLICLLMDMCRKLLFQFPKNQIEIWQQGYKTFFILNSAVYEISTAHKVKNAEK